MKDAQKPDHINLNGLMNRLREGRFVIPDFQREFEWKPWDINALMRSIFLDYYIGSLLLWRGKEENFEALSCETLYGFGGAKKPMHWKCGKGYPEHIVLDGQQRLTALFYAFFAPDAPLPNRANRAIYYVRVEKFMDQEYDDAFTYDWLSKRMSKLLQEPETQYQEHVFPLSVIGQGGWNLPNWVQGYERHWQEAAAKAAANGDEENRHAYAKHAANAKAFGEHLKDITEQYQIAYIELDRNLAVDKVCDIFTQINSKGIRLDVFDLINALLKPKGLQLKLLWREAEPRFAFVENQKMNVYVLQIMSILRQSYCSPKYLYYLLPGQEKLVRNENGDLVKEVLIPNTDDFKKRWDDAVLALEKGIALLRHPQEFGAIASQYLPYISILPVFSALQAACNRLPAGLQLTAQRKIRHWYWASVFTNRYSGAVESTSARDFMDVSAWFVDDNAPPPLLYEFQTGLQNIDFGKETKKGSSRYNGIFNLLVLRGAKDWQKGTVPQYGDLDDHHIIPVSKAVGDLADINVHTILNRTPLTLETNRHVIRDRLPNEYIPELMANSSEKEIQSIFESHLISPKALQLLLKKPFTKTDYEEFLKERRYTILQAIEDLFIKERFDLSPALREMDAKVESLELALRRLIASACSESESLFPPHILQKLNEAILRAVRRNAALDTDQYEDLYMKLEFADLRELQEVITSKSAWSLFEDRFGSKQTVEIKFNQLAEIRNSIRHSRTVDEITRKEGEAAILWFGQVLGK